MDAATCIIKVRKELSEENKKILEHPLIKDAEAGKPCEDKIKRFVIQQNYIITHDLRSLAFMLTRSKYQDEVEFFQPLIQGDGEALKRLHTFAEE
ncbi:MAG: TenA family transcriptional regulator, partial [Nitrososphaerales archaeon]